MTQDSESDQYDLDDVEESLSYFSELSEDYSLEDLTMEDEKEIVKDAVSVINTFNDISQELHDSRLNNEDFYNSAVRAGQMWPEAYQAKETVQEIAESGQITDKVAYGALAGVDQNNSRDTAPGIASSRKKDTTDIAAEVLEDMAQIDEVYREGLTAVRTVSHFMHMGGETPNPIELARQSAENKGYDEFVHHVNELQDNFHETREELNQSIVEEIEKLE